MSTKKKLYNNLKLPDIFYKQISGREVEKKLDGTGEGFKFTPNTERCVIPKAKRMYEHDTSSCRKSSQINDSKIYWIWYCPKRNIFIYGFGFSLPSKLGWLGKHHNIYSIILNRRKEEEKKIHGKFFENIFQEVTHGKKDKVIFHFGP